MGFVEEHVRWVMLALNWTELTPFLLHDHKQKTHHNGQREAMLLYWDYLKIKEVEVVWVKEKKKSWVEKLAVRYTWTGRQQRLLSAQYGMINVLFKKQLQPRRTSGRQFDKFSLVRHFSVESGAAVSAAEKFIGRIPAGRFQLYRSINTQANWNMHKPLTSTICFSWRVPALNPIIWYGLLLTTVQITKKKYVDVWNYCSTVDKC